MDANDVVLAVAHFSTEARGSDLIPQLVIARALPLLAPYIAQVINASLICGIFPEPWRESLLVALKKTATASAPTDFRPIALLCFLSKVLEKIVHDQIQGIFAGCFEENCNTICPHGLSSHCIALFSLQGFGEDRP